MAASTSTTAPVRIVALGGLGEIGLNLMAIECAGRAIVIDCGVMFPDEPALGLGTYIPEMTWFERSHVAVEAVVLTHAHEDHIGALAHLLRRFNVPVYGSDITLAFTRRRLADEEFDDPVDLRTIVPRKAFEAGPFTVEPIRVTHSTPNSTALAIRTPAGIIIHSGDFKIDDAPVDGQLFDRERFAELGAEGVALLLSDSTNVERPGRSGSESSLKPVLRELTSRARGRFFLSAFSSHLHRIRQVVEVSREFGRRVVPLGRAMAESVRLGLETGQLPFGQAMFVEPGEAEFLDGNRLSYLTSGSQGEPLSALAKIAGDAHPRVRIEHGDVVVLSSRFIPGNERTINTLVNRLYKQGADVVYDAVAPVHVSGHASQDELAEMITLTRPRHFVPIHGEYRHLSRHVALAIGAGIPEKNCFLLEDGDSLVLSGGEARRGSTVEAGRVMLEGADGGDPAVVSERRVLARDGTVTAVVVLSAKTGRIVAGPDLLSRGLVSGDGTSAHMRRAKEELTRRLNALGSPLHANDSRVKEEIVRAIRRYFSDELGRRPLVIPYVTEV
jgi:ribonuclease J